jgi:hypothetical protein
MLVATVFAVPAGASARLRIGERVECASRDARNGATPPAALHGADYVLGALGSNRQRDP